MKKKIGIALIAWIWFGLFIQYFVVGDFRSESAQFISFILFPIHLIVILPPGALIVAILKWKANMGSPENVADVYGYDFPDYVYTASYLLWAGILTGMIYFFMLRKKNSPN